MEGIAALISAIAAVVALGLNWRSNLRANRLEREKLALEREKQDFAERLQAIDQQFRQYQALVDDLQAEVGRQREMRAADREEFAAKMAEADAQRKSLEDKVADVTRVKDREIAALQTRVRELEARIASVTKEWQHEKEARAVTEVALHTAYADIAVLKEQLAALQSAAAKIAEAEPRPLA